MNSWRISKYNPLYRDNSGKYLKEEWTSVFDVDEDKFTEYLEIESKYINSILLIMKCSDVNFLIIEGLEKQSDTELENNFSEKTLELFHSIKEGFSITYNDIIHFCPLVLREVVWCKLVNPKMFVHFGYDYYMYIGNVKSCIEDIEEIKKMGLFVEEFKSPYA